ncbi:hypothetical protein DV738_g4577, partial [Chaetothyriales sp. CBS 135597]
MLRQLVRTHGINTEHTELIMEIVIEEIRIATATFTLPLTILEDVEELARFEDMSDKISRIAPDFVKSSLFPQNLYEWHDLEFGSIHNDQAIKDHEKKALAARTETILSLPTQGRPVKSVFGPEGKAMEFAGSSVLCLPTIWSDYQPGDAPQSVWPTLAELRTHGDNRAKSGLTYRTLPLPRAQDMTGVRSFEQLKFIYPLPMDEVRPEFSSGPTYAEYKWRNAEIDRDEYFNYEMKNKLGEQLYNEITGVAEKGPARVIGEGKAAKKHGQGMAQEAAKHHHKHYRQQPKQERHRYQAPPTARQHTQVMQTPPAPTPYARHTPAQYPHPGHADRANPGMHGGHMHGGHMHGGHMHGGHMHGGHHMPGHTGGTRSEYRHGPGNWNHGPAVPSGPRQDDGKQNAGEMELVFGYRMPNGCYGYPQPNG